MKSAKQSLSAGVGGLGSPGNAVSASGQPGRGGAQLTCVHATPRATGG